MAREVMASEATAAQRRAYFQLVGTDGITPATGEAGGQPQVATNGAAWSSAGIGTLVAIGNGRYYADLTAGAVATVGDEIETRYKSANTAECPGDSFVVVAFDPYAVPTVTVQDGSVTAATFAAGAVSAGLGELFAGGAWSTSDDLLARYDVRRVCQLLADDGTAVLPANLPTNPNLLVLLDDATALVASAIYRGGKYTAVDVAAMDGKSYALLKRLVCDLTMGLLYQRRGYSAEEVRAAVPSYVSAQEMLDALAEGTRIFGTVQAAVDAGKPKRVQVDRRKTLLTSTTRVFGNLTVDPTEPQPKTPGS